MTNALPTVEEIAAKYGVDPHDTSCTGAGGPPAALKKTAAQQLADRIKKK